MDFSSWADALLYQYKSQIVDFTIRTQLPAVFPFREFTELGGLMSYGPNLPDMFRMAATYVDKILKGAALTFARSNPRARGKQPAAGPAVVLLVGSFLRPSPAGGGGVGAQLRGRVGARGLASARVGPFTVDRGHGS